jgi:hypothetical protein
VDLARPPGDPDQGLEPYARDHGLAGASRRLVAALKSVTE